MKTQKLVKYVLPAYWTSYLINGDASGISDMDRAAADHFLVEHDLPGPVSCSDESWFAKSNDSDMRLAGDVLEYTFLMLREFNEFNDSGSPLANSDLR